jgi:putative membrane protein
MIGKYALAAVGVLWGLTGASLAVAAGASGASFIKEAVQGNLAEVKVGQLAQDKGATQGVKDFGAALVKDHGSANESAAEAAQQMKVTAPGKPNMKQTEIYDKLAKLSGESFDKQFIKAMVKDHKEDIAKYERESKESGPAADYAKQTLPTLKAHLKMAEDLAGSEHVALASHSAKKR